MKDNLIIAGLYIACIIMLLLTGLFLIPAALGAVPPLEVKQTEGVMYNPQVVRGGLQETVDPFTVQVDKLEVR